MWSATGCVFFLQVLQVTGNGKFHPLNCHEGTEGQYKYTCILSLTMALDGAGGQLHALAALSP
jgi:hypothetical protein